VSESVSTEPVRPSDPDPVPEGESLGRKAGRGLGWGLVGNGITRIGSFATSLALARLLAPHDFGVYAVALAAMQFVIHINDIGLIPATIQWRGRLEDMAATASTLAASCSFLVYGVTWFLAPSFAHFSGVPEATWAIRLYTANVLIDGITAVRSAYLLRTFQQRRYVLANAAGVVVNGVVAIGLSFAGAGAMALVGGQLASSAATSALVFAWARLPFRIGIDRAVARKLLSFGLPLTVSLAVQSILEQSDKVVVGRVLGAGVLGLYMLGVSISGWTPGIIGGAVRFVSLPGFARLSERDEDSLSKGVTRSLFLLFLAVIPIAVLIAVLADPLIMFLYGPKWLPAATPLRFLMILMVVRMVTGLCEDILNSTGATRLTLAVNVGWLVVCAPALWFATKVEGADGAAFAQGAVGVLVALPLMAYAVHRVGVPVAPLAGRLIRPLLAGTLTALVALLLSRSVAGAGSFVQLAAGGTGGMLAYVFTAVPRSDRRAWIDALRRARRPLKPMSG
jgi:O-antigen/teichoic acid export membrane protein